MSDSIPYNLADALASRYPPGQFATFFEVGDATGFSRNRSADALVMGLWPSRGLHLHGFESKVSRSDWKRELDNPQKAESHFRFCDFWWLITPDAGFVKPEEVPATWGWLAWNGTRLVVKKEALRLEPQPMTRQYLAAICRAADSGRERAAEALSRTLVEKERESIRADVEHQLGAKLRATENELRGLKETVKAFERSSGVSIGNQWNTEEIGRVVRLVHTLGPDRFEKDVRRSIERIQAVARDAAGLLASLEEESVGGVE